MTIQIDHSTEQVLSKLAKHRNVSVNTLLNELIAKEIRYLQEYSEDMEALKAMKNGNYISAEDMFTKMIQLEEQARSLANNAE